MGIPENICKNAEDGRQLDIHMSFQPVRIYTQNTIWADFTIEIPIKLSKVTLTRITGLERKQKQF